MPASPFLEAARLDRRCSIGCNNGTRLGMIKVCGSSMPRTRASLSTIPRGCAPHLRDPGWPVRQRAPVAAREVRSKRRWEVAVFEILIDATADNDVARHHPELLRSGIHVATACKLASGTSLELWNQIRSACAERGAGFGDRATVGAGLPLLRSIRELRTGGDRIHGVAGIMSGSLAWLFDRFDGSRPFSWLVREARRSGFTEPDPRDDLSGEDVRRKILILARAAGFALDSHEVEVESLVPKSLRAVPFHLLDGELRQLDAPLAGLVDDARRQEKRLRFVARLEDGRARVGVEAIGPSDPLAGGVGTDNRVAIWSDRYASQPLVIQGPGAGTGSYGGGAAR